MGYKCAHIYIYIYIYVRNESYRQSAWRQSKQTRVETLSFALAATFTQRRGATRTDICISLKWMLRSVKNQKMKVYLKSKDWKISCEHSSCENLYCEHMFCEHMFCEHLSCEHLLVHRQWRKHFPKPSTKGSFLLPDRVTGRLSCRWGRGQLHCTQQPLWCSAATSSWLLLSPALHMTAAHQQ